MIALFYTLLSTFLVSLISIIGILVILIREKILEKILLCLVSLSAGAFVGSAFLHLIPEALEKSRAQNVFFYILLGITLFLLIEKILHWRHCHNGKCSVHTFAYINLLGDGIHNFVDGLIIAASFITDVHLGIVVTIAIAFHEIPQEIGDFGVLVYGGFSKAKALFSNFLIALTAMIGGIIGFYVTGYIDNFTNFLLPVAAGGFIYIALSDLVPEIKKETNLFRVLLNFITFVVGILIIYFFRFIFPE